MNSVLLIFVDGLGIGEFNEKNPLAIFENLAPLAHFVDRKSEVLYDGILFPTDPRLGIEGRPQSASGQTTILTGVNAPKLLGFHKQGFPNEKLRNVLAEQSIFLKLKKLKIEPNLFVNAYSPKFFSEKPRWKSATTCAVEAAEMNFRTLADVANRKALYHDFSNRYLQEIGFDIEQFSPLEAADVLVNLTKENRFTLYEYFITDKIGHAQDFAKAEFYLRELAEFIREVLQKINLQKTTLILTSDHGNIEDLSIRNHTLNNVPTIIWGRNNNKTAMQISDLTHITPAIIKLLSR